MPDKPSRPPQRPQSRGRSGPEELPEDTASPAATSAGPIEVDFDAPPAPPSGLVASIQAFSTPDSVVPHDDLFAARDALIEQLGGLETLASAFSTNPDEAGGENIVGIGVGLKFASNALTAEPVVKVFVKEKLPLSGVAAAHRIPEDVDGIPTDVEDIGEAILFSYAKRYPRPVKCGVSCSHFQLNGSGTLGCVVILNNGKLAILSNNHVLARENAAQIGDPIIQPGRAEPFPAPDERIALLEDFVEIRATGNRVDGAVAWTNSARVSAAHMTYNLNPTPVLPTLGMTVLKNGRTTQSTIGMVSDMGFTLRVGYTPFPQGAVFQNQVVIRGIGGQPFSKPGDSGSLIVTAGSKQPVALLFAGSNDNSVTFANPIQDVITQLDIREFVSPNA